MSDINLPALREAVAKMTEGPWVAAPADANGGGRGAAAYVSSRLAGRGLLFICTMDEDATTEAEREANAAGIVALRNAAPALLDELDAAREVVLESNAVCACGCPHSAHEYYGEDGYGCEQDAHECVPTSEAALSMLTTLRADLAAAKDESDTLLAHANELERANAALRQEREALKEQLALDEAELQRLRGRVAVEDHKAVLADLALARAGVEAALRFGVADCYNTVQRVEPYSGRVKELQDAAWLRWRAGQK